MRRLEDTFRTDEARRLKLLVLRNLIVTSVQEYVAPAAPLKTHKTLPSDTNKQLNRFRVYPAGLNPVLLRKITGMNF